MVVVMCDTKDPYAYENMTTEALIALEERMYDDECEGEDNWYWRDQLIIELNKRDWK
jgi:hypothetical protein